MSRPNFFPIGCAIGGEAMCTVGRKLATLEAARRNLLKEIKAGRDRQSDLEMVERRIKALRSAAGK